MQAMRSATCLLLAWWTDRAGCHGRQRQNLSPNKPWRLGGTYTHLARVRLRRVSSFLSCPADHTTVCSQVISNVLKDKCVRFSAPQEVVFARNDGLPLLDIRPNTQFKQG
jgi:hypothetical protein